MFELCCVKINLMKETRYTLFVLNQKTGEHSAVFEFVGEDEENDPLDRDNPLLVFLKDQGKLYEKDIEDLIPTLGPDATKIRDYATWISTAEKEQKLKVANRPKHVEASRILDRMDPSIDYNIVPTPYPDSEIGAGDENVSQALGMDKKIREAAQKRHGDNIKLNLLDPVPEKNLITIPGRDTGPTPMIRDKTFQPEFNT